MTSIGETSETSSKKIETSTSSKIFTSKNHKEKLTDRLLSQLENNQLCDVFLISGIDGKVLCAHRNVLAAASDYFAVMFNGALRESREEQIVMEDIHSDALEILIEYCYTGRLELQEDKVETLLATANLLQLTDAIDACCNFMEDQLDASNCIGISVFADQLNCECLKLKAESFICENFMEVSLNQEFLKLNVEQISNLLSSDALFISSEEDVYDCVMIWVNHDRPNRVEKISELLKFVRMPLMKPAFLIDNIKPLCKAHNCQVLYEEAIEWHLLPDRRTKMESNRNKPRKCYLNELLIVGGMGQTGWSYIESFCPLKNKWTVWKDNVFSNRIDYGVAVINNELLVFGGTENNIPTNSVQAMDLKTMKISTQKSMIDTRYGVSVALLRGEIYAVGGYGGPCNSTRSRTYMNRVEKWNLLRGDWIYITNMQYSRVYAGVAVLNDKLYVAGGFDGRHQLSSVECYDPNLNIWVNKANMLIGRSRFGLVEANGFLYAIGGMVESLDSTEVVERYDPKTDIWENVCSLGISRSDLSCTLLGERIFAVGGKLDNRSLNVVESYDIKRDIWIPRASLNYTRAGACLTNIPKLMQPKLF